MVRFFLDKLFKPFVAILFFLLFGGAFVFAGHQTVHVSAVKDPAGTATFDFTREHFWGALKIPRRIEGVHRAEIETHKSRRKRRTRITSSVILVSDREKVSLSGSASNLNEVTKDRMIASVNAFLGDPQTANFRETFTLHNAFLWVGLPFFLVGVAGLFGWPWSIVKALRRSRMPDPGDPAP